MNPIILLQTRNKISLKQIRRYFHIFRILTNHYETLKVKPNCTSKEIKDSFIKLSKQNHPDVNRSKEAHKKFVKITEAYEVLSKPNSRRNYDLGLPNESGVNSTRRRAYYNHGHYYRDPWKDPSFYYNRRRHEQFNESDAYYGIKGIKRVPNSTIAVLCFMVAFVGLILQGFAVKYSFTFHRNQLVKQSEEAEELLREARARAEANGNQMQLELFKLKYELAQAAKNKPKDI